MTFCVRAFLIPWEIVFGEIEQASWRVIMAYQFAIKGPIDGRCRFFSDLYVRRYCICIQTITLHSP